MDHDERYSELIKKYPASDSRGESMNFERARCRLAIDPEGPIRRKIQRCVWLSELEYRAAFPSVKIPWWRARGYLDS
jgi:hypothetical protein